MTRLRTKAETAKLRSNNNRSRQHRCDHSRTRLIVLILIVVHFLVGLLASNYVSLNLSNGSALIKSLSNKQESDNNIDPVAFPPFLRAEIPIVQRPLAVIHVGPHKTGSTSIQLFMRDAKEFMEKKDHYWVPIVPGGGSYKNTAELAVCLIKDVATRQEKKELCKSEKQIMTAFTKFVETIANKTVDGSPPDNILMSSEEFDGPLMDIGLLKKQLEPRFEVHIIMYYRRFYQWLASAYNEMAKNPKKFNTFPSMSEFLKQELESMAEMHTYKMYKRFSDHFPSSALRVLNFDDPSVSLEESFFCQGLPRASNACNVARSHTYKKKNPRVSLDWLQILKGIDARGFPSESGYKNQTKINIRKQWEKQWEKLRKHEEEGINTTEKPLWMDGDPPPNSKAVIWRKCPSRQILDKVLAMSQSFEEGIQGVLLTISNQTVASSTEEDFRKQIPMTFCTLDTERLIDYWEKQAWFKKNWPNGVNPTARVK